MWHKSSLKKQQHTSIHTYVVARRASKGMKLDELKKKKKNNLTIVNIITRSSIHTSTISSLQYFLYNFKHIFHILASFLLLIARGMVFMLNLFLFFHHQQMCQARLLEFARLFLLLPHLHLCIFVLYLKLFSFHFFTSSRCAFNKTIIEIKETDVMVGTEM